MLKININKNWIFHFEDEEYKRTNDTSKKDLFSTYGLNKIFMATGFASRIFKNSNWRRVDLPHDYAVELETDGNCWSNQALRPVTEMTDKLENRYRRTQSNVYSVAWYRKEFYLDETGNYSDDISGREYGAGSDAFPENKRIYIEFEGVYRNYILWINGAYIDLHSSGYTGEKFDITDFVFVNEVNSIAVRVDSSQCEGWWYDGAGIYRDVNIYVTGDVLCHEEELYVSSKSDGTVHIKGKIENHSGRTSVHTRFVIEQESKIIKVLEKDIALDDTEINFDFAEKIKNPILWDVDTPYLYTLKLYLDDELEQSAQFGFKETCFNDKGFFLNGKSIKLQGVCLHQDFAGVGVAMNKDIIYYRLKAMKEMGANAVRLVHNPHAKYALQVCDELGLMVFNETRAFGTGPEAMRQLTSLAKRDRNHVSIILWSIGNEENVFQNTKASGKMAKKVSKYLKTIVDDAIVTYGGNNGAAFEGINAVMDVRGINYIRMDGDDKNVSDYYHREYPHQPVFSSEEVSSLATRGVYKNDLNKRVVDAYGENGNYWSSTPEGYMNFCNDRQYFGGGFIWTGFDYRGETTPFSYSYSSDGSRNTCSNYGILDLCGFPKDTYYYYKAWWTKEPVLHIVPHWNFSEGEKVRVVAFTNCDEVSLYINQKLVSTVSNKPCCSPEWLVDFEEGELKAVGTKDGKEITVIKETNQMNGIRMCKTDYDEYTFVDVESVDAKGNPYVLSNNMVELRIINGEFIGAGNGDPTYMGRERFIEKTMFKEIGDLEVTQKIPQADASKFIESYPVHEDAVDWYDDKFRTIWDRRLGEKTEPISFTKTFVADKGYQFVEFEEMWENAKVYLNGNLIGETGDEANEIFEGRRPRRFDAQFKDGENFLEVKLILNEVHNLCDIKDAFVNPRIGKCFKDNKIEFPLFNGLLRLIVKKEKQCRITASTDNGFADEIEL